jgi:hypothetical protein
MCENCLKLECCTNQYWYLQIRERSVQTLASGEQYSIGFKRVKSETTYRKPLEIKLPGSHWLGASRFQRVYGHAVSTKLQGRINQYANCAMARDPQLWGSPRRRANFWYLYPNKHKWMLGWALHYISPENWMPHMLHSKFISAIQNALKLAYSDVAFKNFPGL